MSKTAFAQAIISKLNGAIGTDGSKYSAGSAGTAMSAVALAITEYIIANTTVTVSYTGIIPGPVPAPDPLVTDTFKVVGNCSTTGPSDGFDSWISLIESNIISAFSLAPAGTKGLVFAQTPFANTGISLSQSALKGIHQSNPDNPQQQIWETICDAIMTWINSSAKNTTPSAANNPATTSTGTATITAIIIM